MPGLPTPIELRAWHKLVCYLCWILCSATSVPRDSLSNMEVLESVPSVVRLPNQAHIIAHSAQKIGATAAISLRNCRAPPENRIAVTASPPSTIPTVTRSAGPPLIQYKIPPITMAGSR